MAKQKTLVVNLTWHNFFNQVIDNITNHQGLETKMYAKVVKFFLEYTTYRQRSIVEKVKSNQIKKFLHQILTHAIFHYSPCKDLLEDYDENHKPLEERWATNANLWESLNADPFHA